MHAAFGQPNALWMENDKEIRDEMNNSEKAKQLKIQERKKLLPDARTWFRFRSKICNADTAQRAKIKYWKTWKNASLQAKFEYP